MGEEGGRWRGRTDLLAYTYLVDDAPVSGEHYAGDGKGRLVRVRVRVRFGLGLGLGSGLGFGLGAEVRGRGRARVQGGGESHLLGVRVGLG